MIQTGENGSSFFHDNDSLASLLAVELKADLLVLLTDVNGFFTGPPNDPDSRFVPLPPYQPASSSCRPCLISTVQI